MWGPVYELLAVLNTKISVLDDITYLPVTAFENRVDNIKGGYICIGKLVIVSIQCKIKTTLVNASETGTSSAVITGLPLPDFTVSLSVTKHTGGTNRQSENGNIDINGAVAVQHDQLASFSAGNLISISGAYFSQNNHL